MAKERKDKHFIKQPTYVGGPSALKQFIGKNLRFPKKATDNNIEGTVVVRYTINHKGVVIDAKIISGIGYGCDEEAKRLVKLLKFQVPKHRGVKVLFHKNLKVHFRKPKVKKQANRQVSYTVTSNKKTNEQTDKTKDKKGGSGYSYTINIS